VIEKIGLLYQDSNSLGFLLGVRRRLSCHAQFIDPPGAIAKSTTMTRRQSRLAWEFFQRQSVDLVLRFTDADGNKWQDIRRAELESFPEGARAILVCGVAVENVEQILAIDAAFVEQRLGIESFSSIPRHEQTDSIKAALIRMRSNDEPASAVVEKLVAEAPSEVFRRWLTDSESFGRFYSDVRAAALRSGCSVPNELDVA
jgi:hypothetical protein